MNSNIKTVIRVLKDRNIYDTTTNGELARLSKLTSKTITRNKKDMDLYAKSAPKPSPKDEEFVNC